ncbi:MAG TPA: IS110 family transposase [Chloroflexota bacterium]|nr:IS110 family transposase [Chloroflexota bacterium]
MLYVGVDWAEAEHAACLLDAAGAVVRRLTIPQRRAGLARLRAAIAAVGPDPAVVLVAIERPDGLLVDGLLAAGYTVYALNPKAVQRYRERTRLSGGKTDPADAELLARILVTDRDRHRPVQPSGPLIEELRVLARQDEVAGRDQTRLQNRLRQDLLAAFPAILDAFPSLAALSALRFLERWPTATAAGARTEAELVAFLREQGHFRPDAAAARIHAALHADVLAAPAYLAEARAGAIRLAARQLLLLREQRAAWEKRLRELLEGDRAHPDGEILLGLPGLDVRLAARVLAEIGDRRERFPTPAALQCYAGTAPVTKASGRTRVVVARRACNRFLRQALLRWAFCSLTTSAWARTFYDQHRLGGKSHHSALRILANRWLVILHHLLATGQHYDEAVHQRNRTHAAADSAA